MAEPCRCKRDQPVHLCHGRRYTCPNPATPRFYNPRVVSLAGVQLKVEVADTWACDACWAAFWPEKCAGDLSS